MPVWELTSKTVVERQTAVYIDDQLLPQQLIEGGGPPRRVALSNLPAPVRYIGYAITYGIPLLFLALIIISFIK